MNRLVEQDLVALYCKLVEEKWMLGGPDSKMRQRDFEYLSQLIFDKSKVRLSLSTLKRLWKGLYAKEPHPTTLDALASALDLPDWQTFRQLHARPQNAVPRARQTSKIPTSYYIIAGFLFVMSTFFVVQGFHRAQRKPVKVPFAAESPVTVGVPATVRFYYDFRNVRADSFYVQPNESQSIKLPLTPDQHQFATTYFEPGFHWARLVADDSIVNFASVQVLTDGWLPMVWLEAKETPEYLPAEAVIADGEMRVEPAQWTGLIAAGETVIKCYNVREFQGLTSDNFVLETRVKAGVDETCAPLELGLITEEATLFTPVFGNSCPATTFDWGKESKVRYTGTSPGFTTASWQTLRIVTKNRTAQVFVEGQLVAEIEMKQSYGKVVGLVYQFKGPAAIDFVKVTDVAGATVFHDAF